VAATRNTLLLTERFGIYVMRELDAIWNSAPARYSRFSLEDHDNAPGESPAEESDDLSETSQGG